MKKDLKHYPISTVQEIIDNSITQGYQFAYNSCLNMVLNCLKKLSGDFLVNDSVIDSAIEDMKYHVKMANFYREELYFELDYKSNLLDEI